MTAPAAWVDGQPLDAADVDARLTRLRAADRAGVLPVDGTREGRQLRRWVAQVLVVERLCAAEVAARGAGCSGENPPGPPSDTDAVALGSIVAAAWAAHPAVRQTLLAVTEAVHLGPDVLAHAQRLAVTPAGTAVWSAEELLASARTKAFSRWLARALDERVRLVPGYEHPGDSSQPDHLHRH